MAFQVSQEQVRMFTVYIPLAVLTLAAFVGAIWAFRVTRDLRGASEEDEAVRPKDLFSPLHEAYRAGQMSEQEYIRIRASLEAAGGDLGLVPPIPKPKPATPPTPAPENAAPPQEPGAASVEEASNESA